MESRRKLSRRDWLKSSLALGALTATSGGAFADWLATPRMTEGPFYPDRLPLDTDNDLLIVNDRITPAVGEVTHLTGRILSSSGLPVPNAVIEIWQVDHNGAYLHSGTNNAGKRDSNFQGFGRFTTGSRGDYYFRTIKPVPYPGRTPHIHVKVKKGARELLTTQIFINGDPQNDRDGVLRSAGDALSRELVLVDFKPMPNSPIGELTAHFEIVLGRTPDEREFSSPR